MKVRIYITQEEIDKGGHSNFSCPIYRAAKKIIPEAMAYIQITEMTFGVRHGKIIELPTKAQFWLYGYDSGKLSLPFNFVVEM
jgi:hypothetical protein